MSLLSRLADERFLHHRLRSSSWGGMAGACVAGGLFLWHLVADGSRRWELFAVLATIAGVKMAVMGYSLAKN